ncbi:NADPH-dependent FMN reductase [Paenibacillus glycinis]|uniref:NAD(P)H-dependent oxidoreductase n=1 Tax=Paenibacillus glycinis TaxID=2697035 RepID=A0ABW9XMA7_9BACL|nr:NADPH-dependent FMN reductase [Paenibacillus glycinis]NBD23747.1 NAD(P)H-dependent oxidoreductase [Paenibacillus glycinis]
MAPDNRTKKVGLIVGSLREHSFNRMIAAAIPELEESIAFESISLAELPLYNEDLDHGDGPEPVRRFREAIARVDGIMIVSPEYNSGIPGVLKNALDWASTPGKTAALRGKPTGLVGATPGVKGTILSQQQIRQTLEAIRAHVLPFEKMYISQVMDKVDAERRLLTDETTRKYLKRYVQRFSLWIDQVQTLD